MVPDPGGPKTCESGGSGSGSATLVTAGADLREGGDIVVIFLCNWLTFANPPADEKKSLKSC